MSVYVDPLHYTRPTKRWRYDKACHLMADTQEELHAFAARLGLRRSWFAASHRWPHYDLTANKRQQALRLGALEVSGQTLLRHFMGKETLGGIT